MSTLTLVSTSAIDGETTADEVVAVVAYRRRAVTLFGAVIALDQARVVLAAGRVAIWVDAHELIAAP